MISFVKLKHLHIWINLFNTIGNTTFHSGHIGNSNISVTTNRIGNYRSSIGSIGSSQLILVPTELVIILQHMDR